MSRKCKLCGTEFKPRGRELLCTKKHFYECAFCGTRVRVKTSKDLAPVQLKLFRQNQCEVIKVDKNKVIFRFVDSFEIDGACKKCRQEHRELVNAAALKKARKTWIKNWDAEHPVQSLKIRSKIKETCQAKYGADSPLQSDEIREKIRQTNLKKYGYASPMQNSTVCSKMQKSYKKKTGYKNPLQNPVVKKKTKQTNLKKYGVECTLSDPEVKAKKDETWLKKYGVAHPMQNENIKKKAKQTYKKKTGFDNPSQNPAVKQKKINTHRQHSDYDYPWQDPTVQAKSSTTYKSRTGFNHPSQNPEIAKKKAKTAQKNGNRSSLEDMIIDKLNELDAIEHVDFEQEYYDVDRYPFNCDFYFPKTDTFLEINGHWSHGYHWFDENNKDDFKKLNEWKTKNTKFYDNAIETWTERDPLKRTTAITNNLNYIVLWTKQEVKDFCENKLNQLI